MAGPYCACSRASSAPLSIFSIIMSLSTARAIPRDSKALKFPLFRASSASLMPSMPWFLPAPTARACHLKRLCAGLMSQAALSLILLSSSPSSPLPKQKCHPLSPPPAPPSHRHSNHILNARVHLSAPDRVLHPLSPTP